MSVSNYACVLISEKDRCLQHLDRVLGSMVTELNFTLSLLNTFKERYKKQHEEYQCVMKIREEIESGKKSPWNF